MRTPRAEPRHALLLALVVVAATAVLLATGGKSAGQSPRRRRAPSAWRGLVGSRPRVALGQRVIVVLKTPSLAQRVARCRRHRRHAQERVWTSERARRAEAPRLAARARRASPSIPTSASRACSTASPRSSTRARSRSSSATHDVVGVYPVRVAYPATISTRRARRAPTSGRSRGIARTIGVRASTDAA